MSDDGAGVLSARRKAPLAELFSVGIEIRSQDILRRVKGRNDDIDRTLGT
jgi:hypothetical protein